MTEIHIYGPNCVIKGSYPKDDVHLATSYPVEGAKYSKAYRKGLWDGRKGLLNKRTGSFPTGLLPSVKSVLEEHGYEYSIEDHRVKPKPLKNGIELDGISMTGKYQYQADAVKQALANMQGIIKIATGGGKCLGPETGVLLFDGSTKKAKEVITGDILMGPDSRPREVLSTTSGSGPMYRIIPNRGSSWECNDVHVLTLVHSVTGEVIDIALDEYLKKNDTFKHCHKLFKPENVIFKSDKPLIIDPYFLGLWLGNGSKDLKKGIQITTVDREVVTFLEDFSGKNGGSLSTYHYEGRVPTYAVVGCKDLLSSMREFFPSSEDIRIPKEFLTSSLEDRQRLLAGLVDSDGYHSRGSFEIIQKRKELLEDIVFLARSLGFSANIKEKIVNQFDCNGVSYWRTKITGKGTINIPTIIPRKKASISNRNKDPLRTGFSVEFIGEGPYSGWELDGDGRFLLSDFTVTHNTEVAAAITKHLGLTTLFLVPSAELMYQTQKRFITRLGLTKKEVGIIGDGIWEPGTFVTVSLVNTLESRLDKKETLELMSSIDVLFLDECVHENSWISTENGYVKAKNVAIGDLVLTDDGYQPVTGISRNTKPGIRLLTDSGSFLECSTNHPLAVWRDTEVKYIRAEDLCVGDVLIERSGESSTHEFDPMSYLAGLFAGDGCWHTPNKVRWSYTKDVDWWHTTLTSVVQECLPDATLTFSVNSRGDTTATLTSPIFLRMLSDLGYSVGSKTLNLHVPKSHELSFIGGLFDSEGWITSGNLFFGCASKDMMTFAHQILRDAGISVHSSTVTRKNPKHNTQYKIAISRRDSQKFVQLTGSKLSRKSVPDAKIRTCSSVGSRTIISEIFSKISESTYFLSKKYLGANKLRNLVHSELVLVLKNIIEDYPELQYYSTFLTSEPRVLVEKELIGDIDTVEFSVNENHTFVANGLLTHNCHGAGSETYFTVATLCPAYYRFGLSATPLDRTDGADLRLIATTGDVFCEISNKQLVDLGVSAKADIIWDRVNSPIIPKKTAYPTVYKSGIVENEELLDKVVDWTTSFVNQGLSTLILIEEISHGELLDTALWNNPKGVFIPHQFIHGSEDTDVRSKAIEDFDNRSLPVLICSRILDQGVDTNAIDALIVAGSRKSKIKTMQRLGRGLRGKRLIVVEFANYCHKYLLEHSLQRLRDYSAEKCFPQIQYKSEQDKEELISKLWKAQLSRDQ